MFKYYNSTNRPIESTPRSSLDRIDLMYFAYFDESGDSGFHHSPTDTFSLSALLLHDKNWLKALDSTISFRRYLNDQFHISPRHELKASWLVHNKGDIHKAKLTYPARMAAYKAAMRFQRKINHFKIFTVIIVKSRILKKNQTDVREVAWRYAIERLERFGTSQSENIYILPDEGHGEFIKKKFAICDASIMSHPHSVKGRWIERPRTLWRTLQIEDLLNLFLFSWQT